MQRTPKDLGFVYDEGGECGNRWILYRCVEVDRDYSESLLSDSGIVRCECLRVSFREAVSRNLVTYWSYFEDCDFGGADLSGADFRACRFSRCCFDRAILRQTELRGCDFVQYSFQDADLTDAKAGLLQSHLMGLSKKQRKQVTKTVIACTLLGWPKVPPGG